MSNSQKQLVVLRIYENHSELKGKGMCPCCIISKMIDMAFSLFEKHYEKEGAEFKRAFAQRLVELVEEHDMTNYLQNALNKSVELDDKIKWH